MPKKAQFERLLSERCVHNLSVSRTHSDVCITPLRKMRLFGARTPELIACGAHACVYTGRTPDRVVKFTVDPYDVQNLLRAGPKYAPRVYGAYTIAAPVNWQRPVHVAEVERLQAVDQVVHPSYRNAWDNVILRIGIGNRRLGKYHWRTFKRDARAHAQDTCTRYLAHAPDQIDACVRMGTQLHETIRALDKRGFEWTDVHSGNIGWSPRDKRWKALDLGATASQEPRKLPSLQG